MIYYNNKIINKTGGNKIYYGNKLINQNLVNEKPINNILEYEFDGSQSKVKINRKVYTFTSSPVKVDIKKDLGINEFTDAYEMFNASNITKLITMPDTSKVTSMSSILYGCSNLTSLDLSGWNVENVTDMDSMFSDCSNLTTLDLSGWNLQNVTNTFFMFYSCSSLTTIYMRGCEQSTIDKIKTALTDDSEIPSGQVTIVTQ